LPLEAPQFLKITSVQQIEEGTQAGVAYDAFVDLELMQKRKGEPEANGLHMNSWRIISQAMMVGISGGFGRGAMKLN
jgi:hypothetical protein